MMNAIAMFAGVTILAWMFFLVDWLARRKERKERERADARRAG